MAPAPLTRREWCLAALAAAVPLGPTSKEARLPAGAMSRGLPTWGGSPLDAAVIRAHGTSVRVRGAVPLSGQTLSFRAWAPLPGVTVLEGGGTAPVRLAVANVPRRARLEADGPVEETVAGTRRQLHFVPARVRAMRFTLPGRELKFTVLGDTGSSPVFAEALGQASARGADFLLHAGDLIYHDREMSVLADWLAAPPLPVYLARGNHDYRNGARIAFMRARSPAYYAFEAGGAAFAVLDNGRDPAPVLWRWSEQYRWWRTILAAPREGPLFVLMHVPPFDARPGRHHAMRDRTLARQLVDDCTRAGAAAVLCGHIHESHVWIRHGVPYVVSGEGGVAPTGLEAARMTWVQVSGASVCLTQAPIRDA